MHYRTRMINLRHPALIVSAGLVWLIVGFFLLPLGIKFIVEASTVSSTQFPLITAFSQWFGGLQQGAIALTALSLFVGYLKGRYVLVKSVQRIVARIRSVPEPSSLAKVYDKTFFILIAVMMGLGFLIRISGLSLDIRGAVDVAIGAALINGALLYFRMAQAVSKSTSVKT